MFMVLLGIYWGSIGDYWCRWLSMFMMHIASLLQYWGERGRLGGCSWSEFGRMCVSSFGGGGKTCPRRGHTAQVAQSWYIKCTGRCWSRLHPRIVRPSPRVQPIPELTCSRFTTVNDAACHDGRYRAITCVPSYAVWDLSLSLSLYIYIYIYIYMHIPPATLAPANATRRRSARHAAATLLYIIIIWYIYIYI